MTNQLFIIFYPLKDFMKSTYNLMHIFHSMNTLQFILLISSLFLITLGQVQMPSLLQITQGYNNYFPMDKYFYNYQNFTISDMTSYQNLKNYRFCFIGQQHKPYLHPLSQSPILQQKTQTSEIPYNLDDMLKMDKILDAYFSHSHQTLYIISTKELKIIEILDNKIKSTINTTLNTSISQAQFIQTDSTLLILTESKVFIMEQKETGIQLKEINSIHNENQVFLNVFMYINNVVYVTDDSVNLVPNKPNNQAGQVQNIKKSFVQFEYDIDNAFFFAGQKIEQNIFLVFDEQHTFVTFKIDLMSNESIKFEKFYRFPQGNKCTQAHRWANYIFLECRNHLIYLQSNEIMKCNNEKGQKVNECLNAMKVSHLNIGYHIKAIEFMAYNDVDFLLIVGADKYEVRYFSVASPDKQVKLPNKQNIPNQILALPSLGTFYPNVNINKVYQINMNTSLILSKNTLLMVSQIAQKKEIYCKTVDQNSQELLDQPAGNYNGTLTVQGFCPDMINQESLVQIVNHNVCRLTVRLIVKVDALVQSYQFVWYILLSGIVGIALGLGIYCVMKKRSLDQQYTAFENEKEHGTQVLQQTMVTEPNHQEKFSTN